MEILAKLKHVGTVVTDLDIYQVRLRLSWGGRAQLRTAETKGDVLEACHLCSGIQRSIQDTAPLIGVEICPEIGFWEGDVY